MQLEDIIEKLSAPFPAADHKERKLPGGKRWFYIQHQTVRDRLNEVCPGYWSSEFKGPFTSGNETVMICRLRICRVVHEGIADTKTFPELNDEGKEKIIGSPTVNAARHAFRDAAEQFGVGAYLDDQQFVAKYLRSKQDGRGEKFATENAWKESGAMGKPKVTPAPAPKTISLGQYEELRAIATTAGYTTNGLREILKKYGFSRGGEITQAAYPRILSEASDPKLVDLMNARS